VKEGQPLTVFLNWSKERFSMPSAINDSFPQPPLVVPKSLTASKTPVSDPDSNANIPVSVTKIKTTAEITTRAPLQVGSSTIELKA
jgi:hypothetical protein